MAGRRPQPVEKKLAKGNPGKRRIPKDIPARNDGLPTPPPWFSDHEKACWKMVAGLLSARGQLSLDSTPSLIPLCQCFAEWIELRDDIAKNGRFQTVRTVAGADAEEGDEGSFMERPRPALAAFQDADRRLKGWLIEFGLTDASRGKVHTKPPAPGESPLAKYGLN